MVIGGRPKLPLPPRIVSIDVETTGLHSADRVVTLGAIALDTAGLTGDELQIQALHLVFDPWKTSHPSAEALHGWDDWTLRQQEPFARHGQTIRDLLQGANLIVAHHAAFDLRFVGAELLTAGLEPLTTPSFCTMEAARAVDVFSRASLDSVCRELGLARRSDRHDALEDAWLAMCVYLWLHGHRHLWDAAAAPAFPPSNLTAPPPRPEGPLPRRKRRSSLSSPAPSDEAVGLAVDGETAGSPRWNEVKRICRASGVPLLRSLWSGFVIGPELDVIASFAVASCAESGIVIYGDEGERLRTYIARLQPSERMVNQCISSFSGAPEGVVVTFMQACMDVVRADGVVRPEEERLLLFYYSRITGRTLA